MNQHRLNPKARIGDGASFLPAEVLNGEGAMDEKRPGLTRQNHRPLVDRCLLPNCDLDR